MQVSIVIPSYNQEPYLREAIESAISQTTPCEVIVVDDGSTDDSLRIAREYEPQVKVIQQVNKGLAAARNAGIMNATGEYILPLDADDILMPHAVETFIMVAKKFNAYIVAPSMQCFDSAGNTTDITIMPHPKLEDYKEGNRCPYACFFHVLALREVGGYSPRYDALGGWEDLALMYDLLIRGYDIVSTPEILLRYRIKEQSMWKESMKNKDKLWDQIIKDFPSVASHRK